MKQVTKYEAEDGKLFDSEEEAKRHEKIISIVKDLENSNLYLPKIDLEELATLLCSTYTMEKRHV